MQSTHQGKDLAHEAIKPQIFEPRLAGDSDQTGLSMPSGVADLLRVGDLSILDGIGDSSRVPGIFGGRRAVRHPDLTIGVAEQLEGELKLLGESLVLLDGVEAHAKDDRSRALKLLDSIPESIALNRSPRGVGLGIEPKDDLFIGERGQFDRAPIVRHHLEVGRTASYFQHARTLTPTWGDRKAASPGRQISARGSAQVQAPWARSI